MSCAKSKAWSISPSEAPRKQALSRSYLRIARGRGIRRDAGGVVGLWATTFARRPRLAAYPSVHGVPLWSRSTAGLPTRGRRAGVSPLRLTCAGKGVSEEQPLTGTIWAHGGASLVLSHAQSAQSSGSFQLPLSGSITGAGCSRHFTESAVLIAGSGTREGLSGGGGCFGLKRPARILRYVRQDHATIAQLDRASVF